MATRALSLAEVKPEWSTVKETPTYGPYQEARQYRLLLGLWYNEELRKRVPRESESGAWPRVAS